MKRVRLTSDAVNSYGSRILTEGIDTAQYERNPVLLYMHERGLVIGYMQDIRREDDGTITAEPVFDEASDLSKQCKKQWEVGSLRMVSVGLDIVEMSNEGKLMLPGQTRPTITKSKLFEVSVVDIGANDDAIVLRRDGKPLDLLLEHPTNNDPLLAGGSIINQPKPTEMELSKIALTLGLAADADEATVTAEMTDLRTVREERDQLLAQLNTLTEASISAAVDAAISEHRIPATKKEHFVNLGKKVGLDTLNDTLASIQPAVRLSSMINPASGQATAEYKKLSEVPSDILVKLRAENSEEYRRLYRAEYGTDCEI
jgi:hypothetical protein